MGAAFGRAISYSCLLLIAYNIPEKLRRISVFLLLVTLLKDAKTPKSLGSWYNRMMGWVGISLSQAAVRLRMLRRPRRIILIRHGESQGNVDKSVYARIPDNKLELSPKGKMQAVAAAKKLKEMIGDESLLYYTSPYTRARQTHQILSEWVGQAPHIVEARLREQDFGNFQNPEQMRHSMEERANFGRFYYRFASGESGADVYDRMSSFFNTFFRHMDTLERNRYDNYIIVSHGLTMRLFLMRYLKWSVEQFEQVHNPDNCEMWVLERKFGSGRYELKTEIKYGNTSVTGPHSVPAGMRRVRRKSPMSMDFSNCTRNSSRNPLDPISTSNGGCPPAAASSSKSNNRKSASLQKKERVSVDIAATYCSDNNNNTHHQKTEEVKGQQQATANESESSSSFRDSLP